jgi:hypothetical protein
MEDPVKTFLPVVSRSEPVCTPLPDHDVNGKKSSHLLKPESPGWKVIVDETQTLRSAQLACFNDFSVVGARENPNLIREWQHMQSPLPPNFLL